MTEDQSDIKAYQICDRKVVQRAEYLNTLRSKVKDEGKRANE